MDGAGLYRVDENFKVEQVNLHRNGANANRFIHAESNQCFIGPYVIDMGGKWTYLKQFDGHRLTGTMRHLTDPANLVYYITMAGVFFEMDVHTFKTRQVCDLQKEFAIKWGGGVQPHFKGGYTAQNRVVVSNNGFFYYGDKNGGLFEYDGKAWKRLSDKPHMDVFAFGSFGDVMFCTGWDESSVLFRALVNGEWQRYRLPKATHALDNGYQTEWMRIREIETEHLMVDAFGMFYELQPQPFEDRIWGVRPICSHLRTIPDYCGFRGLLAMGGNEETPVKFGDREQNPTAGQPQSGLWFGKTDDLWSWGKPKGWGGPWRNAEVQPGVASDPFLFTGFENKVLHLTADRPVKVEVQVDFLGNGTWRTYDTVALASGGYKPLVFPTGFSAHWVRLIPDSPTRMSAEFMFT
jgi:hypothetical protein